MSGGKRTKLNKLVRAHCAGGSEALDAVELLHKISDRHPETTEAGKIARLAETKLNDITNAMRETALEWYEQERQETNDHTDKN